MSKKYCICGSPSPYIDGIAPKFCIKCGKSFEKQSENFKKPATSQSLEHLVEAMVAERLKKAGFVPANEDGDEVAEGGIPQPSPHDCIVPKKKFMTVADLQSMSEPIVRENTPAHQDYSSE